MSALRACLSGIGGIDFDALAGGAFCLPRQGGCKVAPRGIGNALGEAAIVNHPVHIQVLHGNQLETVYDSARMLMGEIMASKRDAFMDTGNDLAPFGAFGGALLRFAEKPLRLRQCLPFGAEEAWVVNGVPRRQRGEGIQPYVNTDFFCGNWQGRRSPLAREGDVPLARCAPAYSHALGNAFQRAMQNHLHLTYLGKVKRVPSQFATAGSLWVRERIVPSCAPEAGIAGGFTRFYPTKERLECKVYPYRDALKNLAMHFLQGNTVLLQSRQKKNFYHMV